MSVPREDLIKLLQWLDVTAGDEIDCEEFVQSVGALIDRLDLSKLPADKQPPAGFERVLHHLEVCPECLEEYCALIDALGAE